jgi:hypothetical protein
MSQSTSQSTVRETKTEHGRVYQPTGWGRSVIDWTPPAPMGGHSRLTRGLITVMPTWETLGKRVVKFREKVGTQTIYVRITPERGTLGELVRLADEMDTDISFEHDALEAAREAEHQTKIEADIASFVATLPPGYVPIEHVEHNPDAADGWGLTTFRHGGVELTWRDVDALDAQRHSPIGKPYRLIVYVRSDQLTALVARKLAEAQAKAKAKTKTDTWCVCGQEGSNGPWEALASGLKNESAARVWLYKNHRRFPEYRAFYVDREVNDGHVESYLDRLDDGSLVEWYGSKRIVFHPSTTEFI